MSGTKYLRYTLGLWLTCALGACSFSDNLEHCTKNSCTQAGHECYEGFCVQTRDTTKNPVSDPKRTDSGMSSRSDAGSTEPISTPPIMTKDAAADSGADAALDAHVDSGPMPTEDAGTGCKPGDVKICTLGPATSTTADSCNKGMAHCENNVFGACVADPTPSPEQCNGVDDDCDGKADEGTDTRCYPEGQMGCTIAADGSTASCQGLCALGTRRCRGGKLEACMGAILPKTETCDSTGISSDENCNGAIDEGCECAGTQVRSCYTGPAGTLNEGKCKAGTQSCSNGALGSCTGAIVPEPETCANLNIDDDCNGMIDDIKDRGTACVVDSNKGICRAGTLQCFGGSPNLVCVTNQPATELCNDLDDDCDGKTDETFMLQSDPTHCGSCSKMCMSGEACCGGTCSNSVNDNDNCGGCGAAHVCGAGGGPGTCCAGKCMDFQTDIANCGTCGHACAGGESCCAGKCVNANTDINNCGMCGMVCSSGMQPACCGGSCVDLQSNAHCGACNHACGVASVTCSCAVMNGMTQCVAPTLDICI